MQIAASSEMVQTDEELDRLVTEIIGRVADKWTTILIDILHDEGDCRFGELARLCEGISQKMLTQTLRAMERDGLVHREVFPVVPPKVVYSLTEVGLGLGAAFCGVWKWAAANRHKIEAARKDYAAREEASAEPHGSQALRP